MSYGENVQQKKYVQNFVKRLISRDINRIYRR